MTNPHPIPNELIRIFLPTNGTANTGAFDAIADTILALLTHPAAQRWVLEEVVASLDRQRASAVGKGANGLAMRIALAAREKIIRPEGRMILQFRSDDDLRARLVTALLGEEKAT